MNNSYLKFIYGQVLAMADHFDELDYKLTDKEEATVNAICASATIVASALACVADELYNIRQLLILSMMGDEDYPIS